LWFHFGLWPDNPVPGMPYIPPLIPFDATNIVVSEYKACFTLFHILEVSFSFGKIDKRNANQNLKQLLNKSTQQNYIQILFLNIGAGYWKV
jgi:hypothetical protein